jgi:hypothetical protein
LILACVVAVAAASTIGLAMLSTDTTARNTRLFGDPIDDPKPNTRLFGDPIDDPKPNTRLFGDPINDPKPN